MSYRTLQLDVHDGIAFVSFENPPVNLLDAQMMSDLDAALDEVQAQGTVRVLVLQSNDPEFFVAHGDMTMAEDPEAFAALQNIASGQDLSLNPMMRLHEKLRSLPLLTIVKLRGIARGVGAELVSAADLRFASERAALSQFEAPGGILPGAGGTAYLPVLLGRARALQVILGAGLIDAHTAERWGWINQVVPDSQLDDFVGSFAARVAALPDGVVRGTLESVGRASLDSALAVANRNLTELFAQPAAVTRARQLILAGAQTRLGEVKLEEIMNELFS